MTNTPLNGDLEDRWYQWLDRVDYLHTDPYGYIRKVFDRYQLPYPSYLREIEEVVDEEAVGVTVNTVAGVVTNRDDFKKRKSKTKRKGSRYIVATDFDTIDEMEEMDAVRNKRNNKRRNLCCCINRADD